MRLEWFTRSLPALATAVVLSACVTLTPAASPTPSLTLQPTPSPSPTAVPTAPPTLPPTEPPTAPPTEPPTLPPTAPPTAPPTDEPTAAPGQLDPNGQPNYGHVDLASGFTPDPYTKDMISGGDVDVSYLGTDSAGTACVGFATAQPDFRVNYTAGISTLLRFYFEGSGDATLVINDPFGEWWCKDDSYDSVNPTIDFADPVSGQYDIWVGSYSRELPVSGTLSITELEINHP